jgi:hypothetical protein
MAALPGGAHPAAEPMQVDQPHLAAEAKVRAALFISAARKVAPERSSVFFWEFGRRRRSIAWQGGDAVPGVWSWTLRACYTSVSSPDYAGLLPLACRL